MKYRYKGHIYTQLSIMLLMGLASMSYAQKVLIVPSSNAAPYLQAQGAIEQYLLDRGGFYEVVNLGDIEHRMNTVADGEAQAVVAIGSQAATQLHEQVKPPTLLTYCMVAEPGKLGLEKDPPVEGISTDVPLESQFKLISEALPEVRTIGMLYNSQTKDGPLFLEQLKARLPKGWQVKAIAIDEKKKYKTVSEAIEALFESQIDIVWTHPDSSIYNRATVRTLLLTAIRKKVPVFGFSLGMVNAGALLGTVINPETHGKRVAELTLDLLQHQDTSRAKNYESEKFEIALNMIVAEQLAVQFPEQLMKRSKHIIKPKTNGLNEGK